MRDSPKLIRYFRVQDEFLPVRYPGFAYAAGGSDQGLYKTPDDPAADQKGPAVLHIPHPGTGNMLSPWNTPALVQPVPPPPPGSIQQWNLPGDPNVTAMQPVTGACWFCNCVPQEICIVVDEPHGQQCQLDINQMNAVMMSASVIAPAEKFSFANVLSCLHCTPLDFFAGMCV